MPNDNPKSPDSTNDIEKPTPSEEALIEELEEKNPDSAADKVKGGRAPSVYGDDKGGFWG